MYGEQKALDVVRCNLRWSPWRGQYQSHFTLIAYSFMCHWILILILVRIQILELVSMATKQEQCYFLSFVERVIFQMEIYWMKIVRQPVVNLIAVFINRDFHIALIWFLLQCCICSRHRAGKKREYQKAVSCKSPKRIIQFAVCVCWRTQYYELLWNRMCVEHLQTTSQPASSVVGDWSYIH